MRDWARAGIHSDPYIALPWLRGRGAGDEAEPGYGVVGGSFEVGLQSGAVQTPAWGSSVGEALFPSLLPWSAGLRGVGRKQARDEGLICDGCGQS